VLHMLIQPFRRRGATQIKTLIDEFEYPRLGPGMMWEAFADQVRAQGSTVACNTEVLAIHHQGRRIDSVSCADATGTQRIAVDGVMSTMPLRELVQQLDPPAPEHVRAAAARLNYRDFILVALIVEEAKLFPDNWIYVHDPGVRLGRIQNFKNWSPDLVPDQSKTCLGLEYFCFEGDGLWTMSDHDLMELARRELGQIGLADPARVSDGKVVRVPKAYPVYDEGYEQAVAILRSYLDTFTNLQVAGRNGMHKYNNQDHSMVTGMLAASRLLGRTTDPWAVNVDDAYHEDGNLDLGTDLRDLLGAQPLVPVPMVDAQPSRATAGDAPVADARLAG